MSIIKTSIGNKKLSVSYAIVNGEVVENYKVEVDLIQKPIHPDLRKAFNNMNEYIAKVFYISGEDVQSVQCNGFEISGKDRMMISLHGKLALDSGNSATLKTDNIIIETDECPYHFEDLKLNSDLLIEEVYQYTFKNKQAQLSLSLEEEVTSTNPNELF